MIHLDKRLYSLSKVSKSVGTDQRVPVPDAKVDKGMLVVKSLIPMLSKISSIAGQGSRIEGVYIEAASSFEKLNQAVVAQKTLETKTLRLDDKQLYSLCKTIGRYGWKKDTLDAGSSPNLLYWRIQR